MYNLFEEEEKQEEKGYVPLAEKMRPKSLDEFFGQDEIVGENSPIRKMLDTDNISSMIFYGPPGVGKTTLAKIIAKKSNSAFLELSAVTAGVKDIKEFIEIGKFNKTNGKKTIVFVDEIHRFNKAQQDAFLPHVENGNIILIGATTENPSFEVNSALLSRCKVYVLKSLTTDEIIKIIKRALASSDYKNVSLEDDCYYVIANMSNGDARSALNTLESLINIAPVKKVKIDALKTANEKVPMHLRNAVTKLDSEMGYGEGYKYYYPTNSGNEKNVKEILEKIDKMKKGCNKNEKKNRN